MNLEFKHEDWLIQYHIAPSNQKSLLCQTREFIQPDGKCEKTDLTKQTFLWQITCFYCFSHEKLTDSYFFPTWPAKEGMPLKGDEVYDDIQLTMECSKFYKGVKVAMDHADSCLSSDMPSPLGNNLERTPTQKKPSLPSITDAMTRNLALHKGPIPANEEERRQQKGC